MTTFSRVRRALVATLLLTGATTHAAAPGSPTSESSLGPQETVVGDNDAVFRSFLLYSEQQKRVRYVGGALGMTVGGGTLAMAGVLDAQPNTDAGFLYVAGAVEIGASALALLIPSQAENVAKAVRADEGGHTQAESQALEKQWRQIAEDAERARIVTAIVGMTIGTAGIVMGAVIYSGSPSFSPEDRDLLGGIFVASGAVVLVSSALTLGLQTPAELAFAQYQAGKPAPPVSLQLGIRGLGLSASGRF
jgi:hypothetical protein